MALPLTGVTTTIVKQAIGLASNSVNALCNNYKINKWSKFKPVRYDNVAPNRGVGADWWRAHDGNCGLSIPSYPNIAALFTAVRGGAITWDYLPPTGVAGQPLRLADFRGYEHTAKPPLVPMDLMDTYYSTHNIMGTALDLRVPTEYELTISDIGRTYNLGSMYFGVALCQQGTAGYKYMTESVTMAAGGGGGIDVPIKNELGTYEVVYFLAANPKPSFSDPDIVNTFIPIPDALQIVNIQKSTIGVSIYGTMGFIQEVNYFISIQNFYSSSVSISGCAVTFRYGDNDISEPLEMGEKKVNLGDVVVPANSTIELTGSIVAVAADYKTRGGYLYFNNLTDSSYNKIGAIEA